MENRQILMMVIALLCLPITACAAGHTALVVDGETGKPVEGAIALAQWFDAVPMGLGLGASEGLAKTQETTSDKDGKVFIDDFWGWFSANAQLTVYKPGYVLWDSKHICPTLENRTDFDVRHRTVKLLKFDTEATRWLKEYPERFFKRVGPRREHDGFFHLCDSHGSKINHAFREYELPLIKKEEAELDQKAKIK